MANVQTGGIEAMKRIKSVEPPQWLSPSPLLSEQTRAASELIFSALLPFCPNSPLNQLLTRGFDAEQIWHQIELQTQPKISTVKREVKNFERNPAEIILGDREGKETKGFDGKEGGEDCSEEDDEGLEEEEDGKFSEEEEEDLEEDEEEGDWSDEGIEDEFLKIGDLEKFLREEEKREFEPDEKKPGGSVDEDDDLKLDEEDDDDDDGDEDDDEYGGDADADGIGISTKYPRYEDFFDPKKKRRSKRIFNDSTEEPEDDGNRDLTEEPEDDEYGNQDLTEEPEDDDSGNQDEATPSTHEKRLEKIRSEIEKLERENLETKSWTMQGEITAKNRPLNSALEVLLDFQHNARPVPVITEEVTTSHEDIIKKRIYEGRFDDVQKKPSIPTKPPKEHKALDENKSQKGLAEIYEEEFVQKAGLASAPLSSREKQMTEANMLFKKLCLKLDALSHFHFAPKPVIEDMSIQANIPALAMEEIAPVAVSDAALLAPEEVFAGKGDIKEDAEMTQAERKRRRANKKRKFKAETAKRTVKKARDNTFSDHLKGQEEA